MHMTIFTPADNELGYVLAVTDETNYPHFYNMGFVASVNELEDAEGRIHSGTNITPSAPTAELDALRTELADCRAELSAAHMELATLQLSYDALQPAPPVQPESDVKTDAPATEQDGAPRGTGRPRNK